jgi:hypothetical protein
VPFASLTVFPDVHDGKWQWTVAVLLTAPAKETFVAVIITILDTLVTDSALTMAVIFRVVPSLYVPVAVSCAVPPAAVGDEVEGVMVTLLKVGSTNQSRAVLNTNRRAPRDP